MKEKKLVFGLDIGTRSVTGIVGYKEGNSFNVEAHHSILHDTRAMIDGQVHDIEKVAEVTKKVKNHLEKELGQELKEVCIAAAGRVLVTSNVVVEHSFSSGVEITPEHVASLEIMGVDQALSSITTGDYQNVKLHCVGYSVVKYFLNGFEITNLVGQKATKIGANVLATFLPQEVVDSLCSVIDKAGLQLAGLTLEPIAALNVAIPEQYRLLNIALVDIGAGTSDISITKNGSVIAYGMLPVAGDELTESLMQKYLLEFKVAEDCKLKIMKSLNKTISFKDIMGNSYKISGTEMLDSVKPSLELLASNIAEKIMDLNGGKSPNAVFIVGGGGQFPHFTNFLAERLNLSEERVALRGQEVLKFVSGPRTLKKTPILVTPIGICLSYYFNNANFIYVNMNGEEVKLYDHGNLTVVDVAALVNLTSEDLFPKRGNGITYTVNNEQVHIKGKIGEPAKILVNEEAGSISTPIKNKDKIKIFESTKGEDILVKIKDCKQYKGSIVITANGMKIKLPQIILVNNNRELDSYVIKENDVIHILDTYMISEVKEILEIPEDAVVFLDHDEVNENTIIYDGANLSWEIKQKDKDISKYLNKDVENDVVNKEKEKDLNKYVDEDTHKDIGQDIEQGIDKNIDQDIHKNIDQDIHKNIDQDIHKNIDQDIHKNMDQDKCKDIDQINDTFKDINITKEFIVFVNGDKIVMQGKKEYIFVDIFEYIDFDRSRVRGNLICKINSQKANYTDILRVDDKIEVYWEE